MSFFTVIRFTLKAAGIALAFATLVALSGCWVTSINPLYEETTFENLSKDPDIVFESSLIGSWAPSGDKCTTPLVIASKDKEIYVLKRKGEGEGCTGSDKVQMEARLVKLDSHYFLDVFPLPNDVCDMCLGKHNIFLMKIDKATLSLTPIDSDWLRKALAARTITLPTLAGDTDTITASSQDLKAFCRKYAADVEVFKPDPSSTLTRK